MKKILLTGSHGLIGHSLTTYLKNQGFSLTFFDIKLSGSHLSSGDILNKNSLKRAMEECHGIIHLAGTSRVIFGEKNPKLCFLNNVTGTNNVIERALQSKYKPWVIYASSREVYGEQKILPVKEDAPLKPMNVYAHSKLIAEKNIHEACHIGLTTAILRFSNVFGNVFDHSDRVIPAFCRAALLGKTLYVEGANNVFDFTFVDDVVRGIASVVELLEHEKKSLPPIHFTTGRPLTLNEAAHIITKSAKSSSPIQESPSRSFDVSRFYGDPSRAKDYLGWTHTFTFEEAITHFLPELEKLIVVNNASVEAMAS